ncbi:MULTISPECIES: hypothetical protein [unclassified Streptomyces]|uniref:hypothetical protein n=1 Tax=unclassified Streptomyces TaxID=2593676 RepID=UPI000B11F64A|nr:MULTISPECIES: hypothetical protein [unclassified Streptomyces]
MKEFAGIIAATLVTGIAVQISGTHSAPAAPVHAAGAGAAQSASVDGPPDDEWP